MPAAFVAGVWLGTHVAFRPPSQPLLPFFEGCLVAIQWVSRRVCTIHHRCPPKLLGSSPQDIPQRTPRSAKVAILTPTI